MVIPTKQLKNGMKQLLFFFVPTWSQLIVLFLFIFHVTPYIINITVNFVIFLIG